MYYLMMDQYGLKDVGG